MSDRDELRGAFEWDGDRGGDAATRVSTPRRRRAPSALAGAACVLAAGALVGGLLLGAASPGPQGALFDAARATGQAGGYRFGMTAQATADGRTIALGGGGQVDEHPRSGAVSLSADSVTINERLLPPYVYVQVPDVGGLWRRFGIPPLPTSSMTAVDPEQALDELRSAASITDAGPQTVDGVATTHYHCRIDLARLIAASPAVRRGENAAAVTKLAGQLGGRGIPVDVWVDGQDRVRRLSESLSIRAAGQAASFSITMQLYDYGPQPAVGAPPAGQVQDAASPPSLVS